MAKILLVEDDNNLREIYEARLQAEGYDIVSARDGEEALVVAKKELPDLIISDVMMPRISGFEMLDILRNTDDLKRVKVIMLTALGQAEDKSRGDALGADRYLVKSQVTLEDIVKAATDLLAESGSSPSEVAENAATATAAVAASPEIVTPQPPATPPVAADPIAAPDVAAGGAVPVPPILSAAVTAPSAAPIPSSAAEPVAQNDQQTDSDQPATNPATTTTTPPRAPLSPVPEPAAPHTTDDNAAHIMANAVEELVASTVEPPTSMPAPESQPTPPAANPAPAQAAQEAVPPQPEESSMPPAAGPPSPVSSAVVQDAPRAAMPAAPPSTLQTTNDIPGLLKDPPADNPGSDSVAIANKKIIQPPTTTDRPLDLNELLAKEGITSLDDADHPNNPAGASPAVENLPHQPGHIIMPADNGGPASGDAA